MNTLYLFIVVDVISGVFSIWSESEGLVHCKKW